MALMPILIAGSYLFGMGLVMASMKWVGTPMEKEPSKDLKVRHSSRNMSKVFATCACLMVSLFGNYLMLI
jgi:hypothetical protein